MKIILDNLPIPPTENHAYPTIRNKQGKNIRVTGADLKKFKAAVQCWAWERIVFVKKIQRQLSDMVAKNQTILIRVDAYLGFELDRLFTKHRTRKKIDSSNRIKAAHDAIAEILGIDDRYFYSGEFMPTWIEKGEKECMTMILTTTTMSAMKSIHTGLEVTLKQAF